MWLLARCADQVLPRAIQDVAASRIAALALADPNCNRYGYRAQLLLLRRPRFELPLACAPDAAGLRAGWIRIAGFHPMSFALAGGLSNRSCLCALAAGFSIRNPYHITRF